LLEQAPRGILSNEGNNDLTRLSKITIKT